MAALSPGNTPCGIEMYNTLDVELTSLAAFKASILRFQGINEPDVIKKGIIILHKFLMTITGNGVNLSIERKAFFKTNQFIETVEKEIMNLAVIEAPDSLAEFKSGHGESFKSSISIFMDAVFHKEGGSSWRKEVFNKNLIESGTLCKNVQPVTSTNINIDTDYTNPVNIAQDWSSYVNNLEPTRGPGARQDANPSQLFNYNFTPGRLGFNIQGTCYLCGTRIGNRGTERFDVANCEHVMPILSALHASDFFFSRNEVIPRLATIKQAMSTVPGSLTQAHLDYIDKLLKISPEFAWSHKCCNMLKDNIEFLHLNNNGQYVPEFGNINKFLKWLFGPNVLTGGRDSLNQYDCDTVVTNALRASGGNIYRAKDAAYESLISRVNVLCQKLNTANQLATDNNINNATIIKLYGMFLLFKNITITTVKNIVTNSTVVMNSRRGGGGSIITNTNYKNSKKSKKSKSLDIGKNIKMPMVGGNPIFNYINSLSMDEDTNVNDKKKQFLYNLALQLGATQPQTIQIILSCLPRVKDINNAYEEVRQCYVQGFAELLIKELSGILLDQNIIQLVSNLNDQLIYDMRVSLAFHAIIQLLQTGDIHQGQVFDIDDTIGYLASRNLSLDNIVNVYKNLFIPLEIQNPNSAEIVLTYYLKSRDQTATINFGQTTIGDDIDNENVKNSTYKKIKLSDAALRQKIVEFLDTAVSGEIIAKVEQDDIGSDIVTQLFDVLFEQCRQFLSLPLNNPNLFLRDILYDFISLYLQKKIVDHKISKISTVKPTDERAREIFSMYTETSATLGILLSSLLSVNKAIKVNNSEFTQILSGNYLQYNMEIFHNSLLEVTALKEHAISEGLAEINRLKTHISQQGIEGPVTFTRPVFQQPQTLDKGEYYRREFGPQLVSVDSDMPRGGKLIRKRKATRRNVVVIKRKKHNKSRKHKTKKRKIRKHKTRKHKRL
jgi:hypothetical protein